MQLTDTDKFRLRTMLISWLPILISLVLVFLSVNIYSYIICIFLCEFFFDYYYWWHHKGLIECSEILGNNNSSKENQLKALEYLLKIGPTLQNGRIIRIMVYTVLFTALTSLPIPKQEINPDLELKINKFVSSHIFSKG
jgi:hypothetical protein